MNAGCSSVGFSDRIFAGGANSFGSIAVPTATSVAVNTTAAGPIVTVRCIGTIALPCCRQSAKPIVAAIMSSMPNAASADSGVGSTISAATNVPSAATRNVSGLPSAATNRSTCSCWSLTVRVPSSVMSR